MAEEWFSCLRIRLDDRFLLLKFAKWIHNEIGMEKRTKFLSRHANSVTKQILNHPNHWRVYVSWPWNISLISLNKTTLVALIVVSFFGTFLPIFLASFFESLLSFSFNIFNDFGSKRFFFSCSCSFCVANIYVHCVVWPNEWTDAGTFRITSFIFYM